MALAGLLQQIQDGGARASQVATQQEPVKTPPSWTTWAAPPLGIFVPQVNRAANSGPQEQPYHPLPVGRASVIGALVGPPFNFVKRSFSTAQEAPDEPKTWARIGVPPSIPPIVVPPITRSVFTKTEELKTPPSWTTWPGPVSPLPVTPQSAPTVLTVQEWPDTPPSWAIGHPPPVTVIIITLPGVNRYANSGPAEDPDHPQGGASLSPGFTSAQVGLVTYFEVDQEVPDHPIGWAKIGVPAPPPPAILPAVTRNVLSTQEQPDFTPGWARIGAPPSILAKAAKFPALTKQEQPNEPPVWARLGTPPVTLSKFPAPVTVQEFQEYPDLGYGRTWSFPPHLSITPVPPSTSYVVTQQEVPFHPSAATLGAPGPFGNGVRAPQLAVYNTLFLCGVDGMLAIPGNPPS